MKIILSALVLASLAAPARAQTSIGFVDINKAVNDCAAKRKVIDDVTAAAKVKKAEYQRALDDAAKAKPADRAAKEKAANDDASRFDSQNAESIQQVTNDMGARALRILPKLAAAHHLSAVVPALWSSAKLNLTAELTKRLDDGEGKTDDQKLADLQKRADQAAAEKTRREAAEKRADAAERQLAELRAKQANPASKQ